MSLNAISMNVQSRNIQRNINNLQNDMIERSYEISTGKKQNLAEKLGADVRNYLDIQSARKELLSSQERLDTADKRLGQIDLALEQVVVQADTFTDLTAQVGLIDRNNVDIYVNEAKDVLNIMGSAMNVQWGGRYLLSGDDVLARPIDNVDALTTAVSDIITSHAVAAGGTLTTQAQLDAMTAEIDSVFDNTHPTTTFDNLVYGGGTGDMSGIELSTGNVMDYGVKANDTAIRNMFKGVAMLSANDTLRGVLSDSSGRGVPELEASYLKSSTITMTEAKTEIIELRGSIGFKQERISNLQDGAEQILFHYEQRIGTFENADPYEAGVALSELQRQLESSYYVTAQLHQQSLINFLR